MSELHHIIFAADDNFLPHTATTIASLLASNPDMQFHFHIIHNRIDPLSWRRLADAIPHPVTGHRIKDEQLQSLPVYGHFTHGVYYRLFASELIDAPRALYLDSDMLVVGSLASLLATDLAGHALAAVENPDLKPHPGLGFGPEDRYFNSGLMLIDLESWRRLDIKTRVVDRIIADPESIMFVDQCGLNAIFKNAWLPLHPRYNMMSHFWEDGAPRAARSFGAAAVAEALANPCIVHFAGPSKPWHLNDQHTMKAQYWQHRRTTGFSRRFPDDLSLKTVLYRFTPAPVLRAARRLLGV